jgi:GNAT superfamily N-acetyltransferase
MQMVWQNHGGEILAEMSPVSSVSWGAMTIEYSKAEYGDFDIEAVVKIALAIRPDAFESVAEYINWHDVQRSAGRLCVRWLASVDGQVVGSAYVGQSSSLPPDIIVVYVAVHPDQQSRGYGRALLERAEVTALERGGEKAFSWADETRPRSMRLLERAGYHEVDRGWESTLDLTKCNPDGLRSAVDRVVSSGIRITPASSFALERDDWKRELYRLFTDVEMDVPAPFPIQKVPFEDFEALSLGRRFISDGFFVALDGEQLVGLTEPQLVDDVPQNISQNLTGVRSGYRGRGIAMALKSQAVIWAIESGYTSIRTHNAQSNASMLAINDRLGFKRNHATVEYLKDL